MGAWEPRSNRAASDLIGMALLVGLTLAGALVVLVAAQGLMGSTQAQADVEVAKETIGQAEQSFGSISGAGSSSEKAVSIPDGMQGSLTISETAEYSVQVNGGGPSDHCTLPDRQLGALVYEQGTTKVAYQGGGVWKMTDAGATMVKPPDVSYARGNLSMSFVSAQGEVTGSERIVASRDSQAAADYAQNVWQDLYTGQTDPADGDLEIPCPPSEVYRSTLTIENSKYASAWARWAQDTYRDKLVEVSSPDAPSVSKIEPGDTVSITFNLGSVKPSEYTVDITDVRRTGGDLAVDVTVTNVGGLPGNQPIQLDLIDDSEPSDPVVFQTSTSSLALHEGESRSVTITVPNSQYSPALPSTFRVEAASDSHSDTATTRITGGTGPSFAIDSVAVPSSSTPGHRTDVTVHVKNTGGISGDTTVTLKHKGPGDSSYSLVAESEGVQVPADSTTAVSFTGNRALPTTTNGNHQWKVVVAGASPRTGTIHVGPGPYFEVESVDVPTTVPDETGFDVRVDIHNTGVEAGTQEVTVELIDTDTGTTKASHDFTGVHVDGGATTTKTWHVSATTANDDLPPGRYKYVVETDDETRRGYFRMGTVPATNIVVQSASVKTNPVELGASTNVTVTLANTGATAGSSSVNMTLAGENVEDWDDKFGSSVTLDGGETVNRTVRVEADARTVDIGDNTLSVSTDISTVDRTITVKSSEAIDDDDDTLDIEENITARVTVLGAELEGLDWAGDESPPYRIYNSPVRMWLRIEEPDGTVRKVRLFHDRTRDEYDPSSDQPAGDLNHPAVEKAMVNDNNLYSRTVTLANGSSLSLFAQSYTCERGGYSETDVIWTDIVDGEHDARGLECSEWDDRWIKISHSSNSDNVMILGDGETTPGPVDAAAPYQRGMTEILGNRVKETSEGRGEMQLTNGERVFLYELSEANADPEEAAGEGDPDYNDAVGLFQVVEEEHIVYEDARFVIENVSLPSNVQKGESASIDVKVENVGGKTNSTTVNFSFGGSHQVSKSTGQLGRNETQTLTFDVPTGDTGTFLYELEVEENSIDRRSGYLTIGSRSRPYYVIRNVDAPKVIDDTNPNPTAEIRVENPGTAPTGSWDITLENADTGASNTVTKSASASFPVSATIDIPHQSGLNTYTVRTDDTSVTRTLYVGSADVTVATVEARGTSYSEGARIDRRSIPSLWVKLKNTGTVGNERQVTLSITSRNTGTTVYDRTKTPQVGTGRLTSAGLAWTRFDTSSVGTGYYDYTITVTDPETGKTVDQWTGQIYLRSDPSTGGSGDSDSPISVDTGEVTIGG